MPRSNMDPLQRSTIEAWETDMNEGSSVRRWPAPEELLGSIAEGHGCGPKPGDLTHEVWLCQFSNWWGTD